MNSLIKERLQALTRRHFLKDCQVSMASLFLASMGDSVLGKSNPIPATGDNSLAVKMPHFAAKAKRVIYLHMAGSPPVLDMFDYKPELKKHDGEKCPQEFLEGRRFAFSNGTPNLMGTPRTFKQYGEAGTWMSDAIPNFHGIADDLCVVKSMHTDQFNHAPAQLFLLTGSRRQGRPSLGSWVTYGLGSEKHNLHGCVVLISCVSQARAG